MVSGSAHHRHRGLRHRIKRSIYRRFLAPAATRVFAVIAVVLLAIALGLLVGRMSGGG